MLNIKYVLIFSTNFVGNICNCENTSARYCQMYIGFHAKDLFMSEFNVT